jgi:hypothetical protein
MLAAETRQRCSEVRYGVDLESFSQDDTGVAATVQDTDSGALSVVHTDYLLAAARVSARKSRSLPATRLPRR